MTEPLSTTIATAIVTGAAAAVSDGVRTLISKAASLVRERFRRNPSDQEILDSAVGAPRDDTTVRRLAEALERHMRDDQAFARQLQALSTEIVAAEATIGDQVTNVVSGPVHGNVVQARDVEGGITFNAPPSTPQGGGRRPPAPSGGSMEEHELTWRKASRSGTNGNCVEVAVLPDQVMIRDSKDRRGPIITVNASDWRSFLTNPAVIAQPLGDPDLSRSW